ncbi:MULTISPECIES: contractile injection system tape measure protein [unclassified Microcoleus]|uniref:contractile injection system tape measure protein n=1 Tax=unclassified Microcoleus TaxID=2642155 RepID=UPI002FCFC45C
MANFSHRIRRLRCLVFTANQTEAFAIRQYLRDRTFDTLIPACESAFEEMASGDGIIHISKLELHLKVNSKQELVEVLPELIQQKLNEQLQSINLATIPITQSGVVWQKATAQQDRFATLLHYLQTGLMPWQASYTSTSEIAVSLKETCRQQQSQLMGYLSSQGETIGFYFRLLQLWPVTEFLTLIDAVSDKFLPEWRIAITASVKFVLGTTESFLNRHRKLQLGAAILSQGLSRSPQHFSPPDFSRILNSVLSQEGIDRNFFISSLPATAAVLFQPSSSSDPSFTPTTNLPGTVNQQPADDGSEAMRSPPNPASIRLFENRGELSNREAELSDSALTPAVEIASAGDEFPLFVNHAGIILLHPFISPFFEATGVKQTGSQAIATNQARAAALLHFLATGQEELYEYELGLIKILLGLEPETTLLVGEGLMQEGDREEAETVLQSVINYWTVLRNTSVDGLRSSFLQRSGLVRKTGDSWKLQIETQPFDMLLEHLPWSISIIKLSWMKYPLYTEWQTF